jgi:hypothetical protein
MKGFFDENEKKDKSAKRLGGFIGLVGMLLIAGFAVFQDAAVASSALWPIAFIVSVCLGATAVKDIGGFKK